MSIPGSYLSVALYLNWYNLYRQMQPNQVLGIVLLKLDELSLQWILCGVCLWLGLQG